MSRHYKGPSFYQCCMHEYPDTPVHGRIPYRIRIRYGYAIDTSPIRIGGVSGKKKEKIRILNWIRIGEARIRLEGRRSPLAPEGAPAPSRTSPGSRSSATTWIRRGREGGGAALQRPAWDAPPPPASPSGPVAGWPHRPQASPCARPGHARGSLDGAEGAGLPAAALCGGGRVEDTEEEGTSGAMLVLLACSGW